jgi:hypothetical protein
MGRKHSEACTRQASESAGRASMSTDASAHRLSGLLTISVLGLKS